MIRGPKKKPAAKAKAQGNPGRRPIKTTAKTAPKVAKIAKTAAPSSSAPDWLDDTGRAVWDLAVPKLEILGYFQSTDHGAFARYCDHTSRWLRLREKVDKKGESYWTKSKHGRMLRRNPDFQNMLALETQMRALEDRFGLAPVSREAILGRLHEPPKLPVGDGAQAGTGMPTSPAGMLSPTAFARTPTAGGTH